MAYEPVSGLQECPLCPQGKEVKFLKGTPIDPNDPELGNYCGSLYCSKKAARLRMMEAPAQEWEVEQIIVEEMVTA